jgi:hypothetical protein
MDCREFRNKHVAFVDDVLPAVEMDALRQHVRTCIRCSKQDTAVRRSLLLVRNLPPIEPSSEFIARLNRRLDELGLESRVDRVSPRPHLPSVGAVTALAAGVVAIAYMALETAQYFATPGPMELTPVVATRQMEAPPSSMADAAFVASVPTGMPVWPAVLMIGQSPMRFASMDFNDAEHQR